MRIFIYILFIFLSQVAGAQLSIIESSLKKHISFLADDKLEGRRAGTGCERKAMEYIAQQFKNNGLQPKGTNSFYQPFEIRDGKAVGPKTKLEINGRKLKQDEDFFVFPFSADAISTAVPVLVSLDSLSAEAENNPHFDFNDAIFKKAEELQSEGAKAIYFTTSAGKQTPQFNKKFNGSRLHIPVIYLHKEIFDIFENPGVVKSPLLQTQITDQIRTGHNVIGYIDNNASNTIVLGAHFDHLGYGEDGNSTWRGEGKQIHNGADDNASGTAALIELSRLLKTSKAKNNNYLCIAFSGEELGLFGSKYFVENPTINLANINYMINMDMIGRLNDSSKTLTVGGFGTSPAWPRVIKSNKDFNIKIDSSGSGPSDHTSFYRKDIPVLFYFTGLHADYHKPSDDFDKINYKGTALITQNIYNLIQQLNNSPKLTFTKTKEQQILNTSFKVTLGIMPDYTYSGVGVRADGVTEGRPAAKAGLQGGDIIIKIGEFDIPDINAYMKALGQFKKGDSTTVTFKRVAEEKEVSLTF